MVLLLAVGWALLGSWLPAVAEDEPPERSFFKPIAVRIVNVDVFVADGKGRPVSGLGPQDLRVLEDGAAVELTHFYSSQLDGGTWPGGSPLQELDEDVSEPTGGNVHLAVFIDDTNIDPRRRGRVLDALAGLFGMRLPEGLEAMVVTFDGSLQVHQPFTESLPDVLAALDRVRGHSSVSTRAEGLRLLQEIQTLAAQTAFEPDGQPFRPRSLRRLEANDFRTRSALAYLQQVHDHAKIVRERTLSTVRTLQHFVRALSGVNGRKVLLYVGDGIDATPGEDLFRSWTRIFRDEAETLGINPVLDSQRHDARTALRDLVRFANTHWVSLYAVSTAASRFMTENLANAEGTVIRSGLDGGHKRDGDEALTYLCWATGGRVLASGKGLAKQLEQVALELGHYYSLAYRLDRGHDDAYHTVEVVAGRPGLDVRHRRGYFDRSDADEIADDTYAAAVFGSSSNPLEVAVEVLPETPADGDRFLVPVVIHLPLRELALIPQKGVHVGRVTITVAIRHVNGGMTDVHRREHPIVIPNQNFQRVLEDFADFTMRLVMRAGEQRIAVGVRDELGRVGSTVTVDLSPGESSG